MKISAVIAETQLFAFAVMQRLSSRRKKKAGLEATFVNLWPELLWRCRWYMRSALDVIWFKLRTSRCRLTEYVTLEYAKGDKTVMLPVASLDLISVIPGSDLNWHLHTWAPRNGKAVLVAEKVRGCGRRVCWIFIANAGQIKKRPLQSPVWHRSFSAAFPLNTTDQQDADWWQWLPTWQSGNSDERWWVWWCGAW